MSKFHSPHSAIAGAVLLGLLSACAQQPTTPDTLLKPSAYSEVGDLHEALDASPNSIGQVYRPYSEHFVDYGQRGAALTGATRYHVLDRPLRAVGSGYPNGGGTGRPVGSGSPSGVPGGSGSPTNVSGGPIPSGQGVSHYELLSWERYCNQGNGLTPRDMHYFSEHGTDLSRSLVSPCSPPSFTVVAYFDAWARRCTVGPDGYTEMDRRVFSVISDRYVPAASLVPACANYRL